MGVGVIAEADVEQTSTASTRELEEPTPEEKGKGKEKPKKGFVIDDDYVEIERHPTGIINYHLLTRQWNYSEQSKNLIAMVKTIIEKDRWS